jgi:hypothetical protein
MPLLKNILKVNLTLIAGGSAFTAYNYPELRKDPHQLFFATIRGARCGITALRMAKVYWGASSYSS